MAKSETSPEDKQGTEESAVVEAGKVSKWLTEKVESSKADSNNNKHLPGEIYLILDTLP